MSTSLSDLPLPPNMNQQQGEQQQFDINSMIDAVSNQQSQPQQEDSNMSAGALQYQLDNSQIPYNGPNPNLRIQEEPYMMEQNQYEMMQEQEPELSLVDKIRNQMTIPIIVAVLFVVLSLPQFNKLLTRFFPRFLSESGDMNMMGLAVKALILAVLVLGAKLFL
jgi:hypothetical protein